VTRGKTAGRPRSPARGKRPSWQARLHSWQAILAAVVAGIATVVAAVIPHLGGSSKPDTVAPHSGSISAGIDAGGGLPKVAITSITDTVFRTSPAERYLFRGTVTRWRSTKGTDAKIFVITRSLKAVTPTTQRWLVSPPARVLHRREWVISWTLHHPSANIQWNVILVASPPYLAPLSGEFRVKGKKIIPVQQPIPPPLTSRQYSSALAKHGPRLPGNTMWVMNTLAVR
jgi:hypothetical protein